MERSESNEIHYLHESKNVYRMTTTVPTEIHLTLDIHKVTDFDEWGRNYTIEHQPNNIILITYRKNKGEGEDYVYYLAIKHNSAKDAQVHIKDQFTEKYYSYDAFRGSMSTRYVYQALSLTASHVTCALADSKEQAIKEATSMYTNHKRLIKKDSRIVPPSKTVVPGSMGIAYKQVQEMMYHFLSDRGIMAGFPWFYQVWSRDEMICVDYFTRKEEYATVRKLFDKYFSIESFDGKFPAILPNKGLRSADGAGWLFFRFTQFYTALQKKGKERSHYTKKKFNQIISFFEGIVFHLEKYHGHDGLIFSGADETWMDTSFGDEGREGYCIEIQALYLRMLRSLHELTDDPVYKEREKEAHAIVYKRFFKNGKLIDFINPKGKENLVMRPNLFIAYYVYPWLLRRDEWEHVFNDALSSLWLPWGGLASLDKHSELFCDEYTGENNKSYHRGDSWFFLNCMAGIALHQVNAEKYEKEVKKIISACTTECLANGVRGGVAEVSSASHLNGYGCLSQAWSCALFSELVEEVGK